MRRSKREERDPRRVGTFTLDEASHHAVEAYKAANDVGDTQAAIRGILTEWHASSPISGATMAAASRAFIYFRNYTLRRFNEFLVELRKEVERETETRAEIVE